MKHFSIEVHTHDPLADTEIIAAASNVAKYMDEHGTSGFACFVRVKEFKDDEIASGLTYGKEYRQ